MNIIMNYPVLLVLWLMLSGCELVSTPQESAARIPVHSEESLAELRQSARTLFNGREITIGANAFSSSSRLLLQRAAIRSPDGSVIDTGVDEPPFILELFLRDEDCYLRNRDTGEEVVLSYAECVAI